MWRMRKNNLLINDKDKLFVHRVHLERLLHAKPHVKNKGPETPYFMKNQLSKKELLRSKERKRCYENALIFSRLLEINRSISPYSKTFRPLYCASFDRKKYNFNKTEKIKEISKENSVLFHKLINEKPHYKTKNILKSNDYETYLKEIIIKRHRNDNPNIKFATFSQFKKNIEKSYTLKKSHSTSMFEPACLNSNNCKFETDSISRNNSDLPCSLASGRMHSKGINEYKYKINSNPYGTISTMFSTKRGKNSLTRCQSAFLRGQNKFYNY